MFGGTAIAAIAGAMILAAAPGIAAPAETAQSSQMKPADATIPAKDMPGSPAAAAKAEPATAVTDPQKTLASAKVQDSSGNSIGTVSDVKTSSSGMAKAITVSLPASHGKKSKAVEINATELRYMPENHLLKAQLTSQQINSLPAVQSP